ncbi:hypothetical protein CBL_20124 [Carabus blaptoides fortunei]
MEKKEEVWKNEKKILADRIQKLERRSDTKAFTSSPEKRKYFLTNNTQTKEVKDVRVKRGSEIGSDHYFVVAKIKTKEIVPGTRQKTTNQERNITTLRVDKLKEEHTREIYRNNIKFLIRKTPKPNRDNVEEIWEIFKLIITEATKQACGLRNL